jgi:hypothetical protein
MGSILQAGYDSRKDLLIKCLLHVIVPADLKTDEAISQLRNQVYVCSF